MKKKNASECRFGRCTTWAVELRTTNAQIHTRAIYPEYFGAMTIESNPPQSEKPQNQHEQSEQP